MKKFTKGALITVLVLVILGCTLCVIGAVVGFRYSSIPQMIREGKFNIGPDDIWDGWDGWNSWESWENGEKGEFVFSQKDSAFINNLDINVDSGMLVIEEGAKNQGIHVEVMYRKENSKRDIKVEKEKDTLKISENGYSKLFQNDEVRVVVQVPADKEYKDVDLKNSAGEITIDYVMNAENVNIDVGAGECAFYKELQISDTLYAKVDAGEIDFAKISAGKLELNAGIGEISAETADAEEVILDCGVGELNVTLQGTEADYNYNIDCGVGEVEVDGKSYSGLGASKEFNYGGSRSMDISCGVGEINVEFAK